MVYQKRETRLPKKVRQKRVTKIVPVTRETNRKRVRRTLTHHKNARRPTHEQMTIVRLSHKLSYTRRGC